MEPYHLFILSGLVSEIGGGFVLALDAIGLERISSWATRLRCTRAEMAGEQRRTRSTFTDPNRFISGIGGTGGGAAGYWISQRLPIWGPYLPRFVSVLAAAVIGGVCGVVVGLTLYRSSLLLLHHGASALMHLEQRARLHATGVLGFGLLFIGFLLQFVGTLGDMLRR